MDELFTKHHLSWIVFPCTVWFFFVVPVIIDYLYILDPSPLLYVLQTSFTCLQLDFSLSYLCLLSKKEYNFNVVIVSNLFLFGLYFCILWKKSLPFQSSWGYLSILSWKAFLFLTFGFIIHLELFSIYKLTVKLIWISHSHQRRDKRNDYQNLRPAHEEETKEIIIWIHFSLSFWSYVRIPTAWGRKWNTSAQPLWAERKVQAEM